MKCLLPAVLQLPNDRGALLGGPPHAVTSYTGIYLPGAGGGGARVGEAGTDRCRVRVTALKLWLVPPTPHSTLRQSIF